MGLKPQQHLSNCHPCVLRPTFSAFIENSRKSQASHSHSSIIASVMLIESRLVISIHLSDGVRESSSHHRRLDLCDKHLVPLPSVPRLTPKGWAEGWPKAVVRTSRPINRVRYKWPKPIARLLPEAWRGFDRLFWNFKSLS